MTTAIAWDSVRLVVFDVDGTLYDQRRLRLAMAAQLGWHCLCRLNLRTARVLRHYRHFREQMADREIRDFERAAQADLVATYGADKAALRELIADWMEIRPLPHLAAARRPGVTDLFNRLCAAGKAIGIVSDYPARAKLAARGLNADFVVSATDREVNVMKPDPAGLLRVMALAGVSPAETVMIGDRPERDGEAARRAGVQTLIIGAESSSHWTGFKHFREIFPAMPGATGGA